MGMVLLAMLCLGRPVAPAFADGALSGASVGVERSGEVAALLRVTGKAQALEVRAVRPALMSAVAQSMSSIVLGEMAVQRPSDDTFLGQKPVKATF